MSKPSFPPLAGLVLRAVVVNPERKSRPQSSAVAEERKPSGKKKTVKKELSRTKSFAVPSASPESKARHKSELNPRYRSAPLRRHSSIGPAEVARLEEEQQQIQILEEFGPHALPLLDKKMLREHVTGVKPFSTDLESAFSKAVNQSTVSPGINLTPSGRDPRARSSSEPSPQKGKRVHFTVEVKKCCVPTDPLHCTQVLPHKLSVGLGFKFDFR